ncbi:tetratricopeptide repeat protein [Clostridium manihotivorum]|uniref:Uncharacterized protein n=1 Tax=Clostridium manihotivorum TaxID=2320868 RepID=A0A3R5X093_9CLOT|nr:tetratricopeptide repeat protein [Clostridium manihotivorum]QAA31096.1 hypothetical protein C1I91_05135 [Clostridium manihotivorum]
MILAVLFILVISICIVIINKSFNKKELFRKYNLYLSKANEYLELYDIEKAIQIYDKAIDCYPEYFFAYKLKCDAYIKLENYEQALIEINKAIDLCDSDVASYKLRILCNVALDNNPQQIIDDSDIILELNSFNDDADFYKGIAYISLGDLESAVTFLDKYIKNCNDNSTAYFYLAIVYSDLNNTDLALNNISKAIELDKGNLKYYRFKASLYITKHLPIHDTLPFLYEANNLFPKELLFLKSIIYCHIRTKDYQDALDAAKKLIMIEDSVESNSMLYSIYMDMNDYNTCLKISLKMLELDDTSVKALNYRTFAYILLGNYELALDDIIRLLELDTKSSETYKNYSYLLYKIGNIKFAEENILKAIELDSSKGQYYIILSAINLINNNVEQALKNLSIASEKNINNYVFLEDVIFDKIKHTDVFIKLYNSKNSAHLKA